MSFGFIKWSCYTTDFYLSLILILVGTQDKHIKCKYDIKLFIICMKCKIYTNDKNIKGNEKTPMVRRAVGGVISGEVLTPARAHIPTNLGLCRRRLRRLINDRFEAQCASEMRGKAIGYSIMSGFLLCNVKRSLLQFHLHGIYIYIYIRKSC